MTRLLLAAVLLTIIIGTSFVPVPEDKVVFLDVGQGDAILLQSGTKQVLIDGGPGSAVISELSRELPWFDRTIDILILTHPQRDHVEGLLHVLEHYNVNLAILPAVSHTSQLQANWLTMLQDHQVPHRFAWAGQKLSVGDLQFNIIAPIDSAPFRAAAKSDINNASTSARVNFHGLSLLLTGDAEERAEKMLLANTAPELLDVDIIKAGHHGSKSSTTAELVAAASPRAAVISVGRDNQFGHPVQAVLDRLAHLPLYRTDQHGPITFRHHYGQWLTAPSLLQ